MHCRTFGLYHKSYKFVLLGQEGATLQGKKQLENYQIVYRGASKQNLFTVIFRKNEVIGKFDSIFNGVGGTKREALASAIRSAEVQNWDISTIKNDFPIEQANGKLEYVSLMVV